MSAQRYILLFCILFFLSGCATEPLPRSSSPEDNYSSNSNLPLYRGEAPYSASFNEDRFASRLPQTMATGEKTILVDPRVFAWGAYDAQGQLVRAGIANGGADFCQDDNAPCHTTPGTYRIFAMKGEDCVSKTYPIGKGGSLMPYCMFFNKGQSLHGSPDQMLVEANISHGCVHMRIPDVQWLQNKFARIGTKVVVEPY